MKTNITITLLAVCGALALTSGCNKQDTAASDAANQMEAATESAAQDQKAAEAQKQADAAKLVADKAAVDKALADKAVTEKAALEQAAAEKAAADKAAADKLAQAAAAQEQSRIQSLIDTAQNLAGQNKYTEALNTLGVLANVKLSPEQQAIVDKLKAAIEKQAAQAATDKATSSAQGAIGNALSGQN